MQSIYNSIIMLLNASLDTSFWNRAADVGVTAYLFSFFRVYYCQAVRNEIVTTDPTETALIYPQAMLFTVFEEDGRLKIRWSSMLSMTLEHWHFDTFKGSYNKAWFPVDYVSFILSEDGKVVKMQSSGASWGKK